MAATTETHALDPPSRRSSRTRVERRARPGWTSWVTTTDHKRIGIMYLVTHVRLLHARRDRGAADAPAARRSRTTRCSTPQTYNELFTMHGTTMIFLFVVPIMAGFGNYFVPLMIGARDMAFPRLNALSFWLLLAGGIVFYASLFFNPPEAGWTCYPPLSSSAVLARAAASTRGSSSSTSPASQLARRRDQLLRDDRQHARARHGLGPPAAVRAGRS